MIKKFFSHSILALSGIFFYSLGPSPLLAQDFRTRSYKYPIGMVKSVEGTAIALSNFDRTLQYLHRGDQISNKLRLATRSDSKIVISLGKSGESFITLGPNTRISILYQSNSAKTLIRMIQGTLRYTHNVPGAPDVFIAGKSSAHYYSSHSFDAVIHSDKFYFRKNSNSRVYKYTPRNVGEKDPLEIGSRDLELLTENFKLNKPTYRVRKKSTSQEPKKEKTPELAEAASIFGESVLDTSSSSNIDDIFGSSESSSDEQLGDIFGEETSYQTRKEKKKVKGNIGLQLEKENPPLPRVEMANEDEEIGPFDISLYLKSTFYSALPRQDVGSIDSSSFHQDVRVTLGNKLNLSSSESLTFSGWLEGSNRKNVYNDVGDTLDFQSSKRNYFNLNELYYTQSTSDYDIQFGKKVVKVGKGIIYSPTDSISATDVTVPTSPLFIGNVILSLDYYLKNWTLSTIFFPVIVPNKSPAQNSRWTTLYTDIDYQLEQEFPSGFSLKSKQIFVKLEGTHWGTDWMFSFFNGPNSNPVIRNDIEVVNNEPQFTLVQEYIPITFLSMGFSTTFKGLEVHGEILNQNAQDGKDDSFTAFMLGGRYTLDRVPKNFGLNSIDIIIEHGRENLRSSQTRPFYALSSIGSRLYQNSWLGTIIFNVNDELSFNYDFHFDNKNDGEAIIYGINYTYGSSQWRAKMETFEGSDDSNFGLWRDNDNISLEYNYTF